MKFAKTLSRDEMKHIMAGSPPGYDGYKCCDTNGSNCTSCTPSWTGGCNYNGCGGATPKCVEVSC